MKRVTIDIPEDMHDWLKSRWDESGQTMAGQVRVALREYRKQQESNHRAMTSDTPVQYAPSK